MLPHAGVGGCTPKPRNEMAASATTNCENCRLATTMMDGATLGSTWRKSRRGRPTPIAAELVGAERMARRARRLEAAGEVGGHRVGRRQPGRADRGDDDREGERQAEVFLHDRIRTRGSSQA